MKIGINYLKKNLNLDKLLNLLNKKKEFEYSLDYITESVLDSAGFDDEDIPGLKDPITTRENLWLMLHKWSLIGDLLIRVSPNFLNIKIWGEHLENSDLNLICTFSKKNKKYYLIVSEYKDIDSFGIFVLKSSTNKQIILNKLKELKKNAISSQTLFLDNW